MNIRKLQEIMEDRGAWSAAVHGVTKGLTMTVTEQQQIHISIERASFTLCNNPFIVEEKELKRP